MGEEGIGVVWLRGEDVGRGEDVDGEDIGGEDIGGEEDGDTACRLSSPCCLSRVVGVAASDGLPVLPAKAGVQDRARRKARAAAAMPER